MSSIHGGDIYRNKIEYDFSVSLNPLECPKEVRMALLKAADRIESYPDIEQVRAREAIAEFYGIEKENVFCSNGASEMLMAIAAMRKPKKALLTAPSFYGYEHALKSLDGCKISCHYLLEENDFRVTDDIIKDIEKNPDIIFLCNPNNPTGKAIDEGLLKKIIESCKERDITLILDECFQELSEEAFSVTNLAVKDSNLIVVKAFTKLFSIPGVRLGFAIASADMIEELRRYLPEWNFSVFCEETAIAACKRRGHIEKSRAVIRKERDYLNSELKSLRIKAFPSDANFILFKTEKDIFKPLCDRGILIRDCSNFKGLGRGFYRIGIKDHDSNTVLIDKMKEVLNGA